MRAPIEKSSIRKSSVFSLQSAVLTLAAIVAASVVLAVTLAPPKPLALDSAAWSELAARTVSGAYHIHTTRSDGHGDKAAVAAAAARAGTKFIILTDHGDGTRPPDAPAYIEGVLVLDGVEISTDEGHYVAFDMPRAPYPLGGSADAVIEDVARLGGFGVAAHPDSPKASLRWTSTAPVDGIEWLNLDSEWRDESRPRLATAGLAYFVRAAPALATLLDRPATLDRWSGLTPRGPVVALAAADAHGGVGRRAEDPGRSLAGTIGIPGYEASFRAFTNRVVLERPLSGDAAADARAVYGALREGRVFSAIDALAGPALLDFWVESGFDRAPMGAVLQEDSDATIFAKALVPPGGEIHLLRNGRVIATAAGDLRRVLTSATGAYRIEVHVPGAPGAPAVPWLVSNPIYFGTPGARGDEGARSGDGVDAKGAEGARVAPFPWRIEKDPRSSATLRTAEFEVDLEYKLAEGERNNQFVALASDLGRQLFSVIELTLAGDRPLRVSVQLRRADGTRWGRSYYVDPAGTRLRVPVADLAPVGHAAAGGISGADAASILIVVDLANANPGRAGILRVKASALTQ
jgi:hypothetical protein